jgi:hypothetical protein
MEHHIKSNKKKGALSRTLPYFPTAKIYIPIYRFLLLTLFYFNFMRNFYSNTDSVCKNLPHITSNFPSTSMFVAAELQTAFHISCVHYVDPLLGDGPINTHS